MRYRAVQSDDMGRKRISRPEVHRRRQKRGWVWRAEWRNPDGRHRVETWLCKDHTKSEAQEKCDALVRREREQTQPSGALTVAEWWERWWAVKQAHLARNSRGRYESAWTVHLKPVIGGKRMDAVNRLDMDALIVGMAQTKGYSLCRCVLSLAHSLFADAQEDGIVQRNPARQLRVPRTAQPTVRTRALSADEVRRVIETAPEEDRLLWQVLVLTGMRISEVLGLRPCDLLPGKRIRVDHQLLWREKAPTKTRQSREVAVPPALWDSLCARAAGGGAWLFADAGGRARTRQNVEDGEMSRARVAAGIPDLTLRMMRTTYATLHPGELADLAEQMGHKSAGITLAVYRHGVPERQAADAAALERALFLVPKAG